MCVTSHQMISSTTGGNVKSGAEAGKQHYKYNSQRQRPSVALSPEERESTTTSSEAMPRVAPSPEAKKIYNYITSGNVREQVAPRLENRTRSDETVCPYRTKKETSNTTVCR